MKYKDKLFRTIACLLAAHFMVMLGKDMSTVEALTKWTYYPTVLLNYGICLLVAAAVRCITIQLDKNFDWHDDIGRRALLQLLFGVGATSILAFFLVWIYFSAFSQDIHESGYLDYEFPFAVTLIAALNLYYVTCYFYMEARAARMELPDIIPNDIMDVPIVNRDQLEEYIPPSILNYSSEPILAEGQKGNRKKGIKEILIIDTPIRSIPIKVADVALFVIYQKTVYVGLKGMKSFNEYYPSSGYLSDIMEWVGERDFFRINRQCVVNFEVIGSYENFGERGLKIVLKPEYARLADLDESLMTKICMVSVDKVMDFKEWMNR